MCCHTAHNCARENLHCCWLMQGGKEKIHENFCRKSCQSAKKWGSRAAEAVKIFAKFLQQVEQTREHHLKKLKYVSQFHCHVMRKSLEGWKSLDGKNENFLLFTCHELLFCSVGVSGLNLIRRIFLHILEWMIFFRQLFECLFRASLRNVEWISVVFFHPHSSKVHLMLL